MTDPPRRSLAAVEVLPPTPEGHLRTLLTCDCGTLTDLTVVIHGDPHEASVTCDGCGTAHWFTPAEGGAVSFG